MRSIAGVILATAALAAWIPLNGGMLTADAGKPAAAAADAAQAEGTRLNEWFAARWEEQLDFSPIQKTVLGLKEDNDKIDDFSEAGQDAQLAWYRRATAEMKSMFDYERLTPEGKTSFDIWVYQLERAVPAVGDRVGR